jgi:hypothetical protein
MTNEDIIRMARKAGFDHIAEADYWHPLFERFAALVAAAEREACAELIPPQYFELRDRIRARGQS